jgi:hypothetical protein
MGLLPLAAQQGVSRTEWASIFAFLFRLLIPERIAPLARRRCEELLCEYIVVFHGEALYFNEWTPFWHDDHIIQLLGKKDVIFSKEEKNGGEMKTKTKKKRIYSCKKMKKIEKHKEEKVKKVKKDTEKYMETNNVFFDDADDVNDDNNNDDDVDDDDSDDDDDEDFDELSIMGDASDLQRIILTQDFWIFASVTSFIEDGLQSMKMERLLKELIFWYKHKLLNSACLHKTMINSGRMPCRLALIMAALHEEMMIPRFGIEQARIRRRKDYLFSTFSLKKPPRKHKFYTTFEEEGITSYVMYFADAKETKSITEWDYLGLLERTSYLDKCCYYDTRTEIGKVVLHGLPFGTTLAMMNRGGFPVCAAASSSFTSLDSGFPVVVHAAAAVHTAVSRINQFLSPFSQSTTSSSIWVAPLATTVKPVKLEEEEEEEKENEEEKNNDDDDEEEKEEEGEDEKLEPVNPSLDLEKFVKIQDNATNDILLWVFAQLCISQV